MTKKHYLGFIAWMVMGLCLYYAGKKAAIYSNQKKVSGIEQQNNENVPMPQKQTTK
jgi:hypothetical protein